MTKQVNQQLIILARETEGLTQKELADRVGINQANISRIENGFISVSEEMIKKISEILHYPESFFYETGKTYSTQLHYFRKAKALTIKDFSRINAEGIVDRLRIEKLLNAVEIETEYVKMGIEEYDNPEVIADELRKFWKVSMGPISNVTALLEGKGIIVVPIDFGTRLISDITTQTEKGIQIIFLNSLMPPDRKRFTLCHALGHIIMHNSNNGETLEVEADRFAGEFLMPKKEIQHQLVDLNFSRLADLKRYWKVSMAAILMKAGQIGAITTNRKQYLWKTISAKGYRLNEPIENTIQDEDPTILREIINMHRNELKYKEEELVDLIFLRESDFKKFGLEKKTKLKLIHNIDKN